MSLRSDTATSHYQAAHPSVPAHGKTHVSTKSVQARNGKGQRHAGSLNHAPDHQMMPDQHGHNGANGVYQQRSAQQHN